MRLENRTVWQLAILAFRQWLAKPRKITARRPA